MHRVQAPGGQARPRPLGPPSDDLDPPLRPRPGRGLLRAREEGTARLPRGLPPGRSRQAQKTQFMKMTAVSKVLIDPANGRVTLGLTGDDGDIEITVPLARIPTLAASLIY